MRSTRRKACGVIRVQYIKLGLANDRQRYRRAIAAGQHRVLKVYSASFFLLWFE
jgi:hypothetical protein